MKKEMLIFYVEIHPIDNTQLNFQQLDGIITKIRDELLEYDYYGYEITKHDNYWVISIVYNNLTHEEVLRLATSLQISVKDDDVENLINNIIDGKVWVEIGTRFGEDSTQEEEYLDIEEPQAQQMFDSLCLNDNITENDDEYSIYSDLTNNLIGNTANWQNVVKIPQEFRTDKYNLGELAICSISELLSTFFEENGNDKNGNQLYKSLANGKDYTLGKIFSLAKLSEEDKSVLLNNIE